MNYTTIEQSKKLLELGLKPESADMCYEILTGDKYPQPLRVNFTDEHWMQLCPDVMMPCWSLGALFEVMPKICEDENDGGCYPTLCKGFNTDKWHCVYRSSIYITDWYDNSIDAVFEMIVWLLENGYIETEKI